MTLWDQLGGRTWGERAGSPPGGLGPRRRRAGRRRGPALLRRAGPGARRRRP
jgi:hypothetical protein